jgi:parallel beta-helix repeat protein
MLIGFAEESPTYVEGDITQNTTWVKQESPYVVINDLTIDPGIKLTINSGVIVKFGGDFSLSVEGQIYAVGAPNDQIVFTSNKLAPGAGEWEGIGCWTSGTYSQPGSGSSVLRYCTIEYAKYGIQIRQDDYLVNPITVDNCHIQNNDDGIMINGNSKEKDSDQIKNSKIAQNVGSGITVNCFNGAEGLVISGNEIMQNGGDGIDIKVTDEWFDASTNIVVTRNALHDNNRGIHGEEITTKDKVELDYNEIYANTQGVLMSLCDSVSVTRNSVHDNTGEGIMWENCPNCSATSNDIFSNGKGMDVWNSQVHAEHSFWGSDTGPYHESLNPQGTGNSVGGDGTDLHFIPWETHPVPVPELSTIAVVLILTMVTGFSILFAYISREGLERQNRATSRFAERATLPLTILRSRAIGLHRIFHFAVLACSSARDRV